MAEAYVRHSEQSERLSRLYQEAQEKWPASAPVDALNNLHHEIVRKLLQAVRDGAEVKDLAADLQILTDESRRLERATIVAQTRRRSSE